MSNLSVEETHNHSQKKYSTVSSTSQVVWRKSVGVQQDANNGHVGEWADSAWQTSLPPKRQNSICLDPRMCPAVHIVPGLCNGCSTHKQGIWNIQTIYSIHTKLSPSRSRVFIGSGMVGMWTHSGITTLPLSQSTIITSSKSITWFLTVECTPATNGVGVLNTSTNAAGSNGIYT